MSRVQKRAAMLVATCMITLWPCVSMAADAPKVMTAIGVKVKGDQNAYLDKVKKLNGIMKRLDTGGSMRVWRATLAGEDTGTLYVVLEYPSLEAYAKATTKAQADDEWKALVKEIDASGIREMRSNSLLVEVTPQ